MRIHFIPIFSFYATENRKPIDVFRNIHVEREHCPKLANNHGMLVTVFDKQNCNMYICMNPCLPIIFPIHQTPFAMSRTTEDYS